MLLREEHLLARPFCSAPMLHPPLQRSQLAVRKPSGMLTLQRLEQCLCLQTRIGLHQFPNFLPYVKERIRSRAPAPICLLLAGQLPAAQILSRCLWVHASFSGRDLLVLFCLRQPFQPPHLSIGDHLSRVGSAIFDGRLWLSSSGNVNCRWPGVLIVANHKRIESYVGTVECLAD